MQYVWRVHELDSPDLEPLRIGSIPRNPPFVQGVLGTSSRGPTEHVMHGARGPSVEPYTVQLYTAVLPRAPGCGTRLAAAGRSTHDARVCASAQRARARAPAAPGPLPLRSPRSLPR